MDSHKTSRHKPHSFLQFAADFWLLHAKQAPWDATSELHRVISRNRKKLSVEKYDRETVSYIYKRDKNCLYSY